MQINLTFDSSVAGAPAGFTTTLLRAAHDLGASIDSPAVITLDVGWGKVHGAILPPADLAAGGPSTGAGAVIHYTQLVAALKAMPNPDAARQTFLHNLPAADPLNGGSWFIPIAQARVLGLPVLLNPPPTDGSIGFASAAAWNFTSGATPSNQYDLYAIAKHEITHALGRYAVPQGSFFVTLFDLTNYAPGGGLDLSGGPFARNFSINGGAITLAGLDGSNDASDLAPGHPLDAFNVFASLGPTPYTTLDQIVMDVIGYRTISNTYDFSWSVVSWTANLNQHVATSADVGIASISTIFQNVTGGTGNDVLVGNGGNNTLIGGAGNDTLNGATGADAMKGGIGNDVYYVDNAGDVVTEAAGQGTDTVYASVNYALAVGSAIEFLRGTGTSGLSLTGNILANTVAGTSGNDTLNGGAGNDTLNGGTGGNDIFKFLANFGQDTIVAGFDFNPVGGQDMMDISGLGITAATFAANVTVANGGGGATLVTIGANSIRLLAVGPANITQSDFVLT